MSFFGIEIKILNTIFALWGFYAILRANFKTYFWIGVFIGIFWFWWIIVSLIYYDLTFLMPIELFFISITFGIIFAILGLVQNIYIRGLFLLFISYLHPFGLNWFVPELSLIDSYFGVTKLEFLIFLSALICFINLKKWEKIAPVIILVILMLIQPKIDSSKFDLKIYLSKTKIPQKLRWEESWLPKIIRFQFEEIDRAIKNQNDIVVLTESSFPLILNNEPQLMDRLKKLSKKIVIVLGSIYQAPDGYYNSTYYFIDGEYKLAKKIFLVPFGEEIPFPKFLTDLINKIFFNGAEDYQRAKNFFDIEIKGVKFRNAICFEVTVDKLYRNSPKYIIATSNNGWFYPSIEPTLQNLLIKFYTKKYDKIVYHSANMGI